MPEGLIISSRHACFDGAVVFHEHHSETFDVTMCFAGYAPATLRSTVAEESQG